MPICHVNADDFGLHPDIDHGIWQCVQAHRVSGVSVVASVPALDWGAVRDLASHDLDVGVHVTLVGEPWLTQPRVFKSWATLMPWLTLPTSRRALEREVRGQIELFLKNRVKPAHLDSHQHVHVMPRIWPTVTTLAAEYGIARVRVPRAATTFSVKPSMAGRVLQRLSEKRGGEWPCIGLAAAGHNTVERLSEELKAANGQHVELVAHPGLDTPALQARYPSWKFDWKSEQAALLSDAWGKALERHGYTIDRATRRP